MSFVFDIPRDGYVFPTHKAAFVEACQADLPNSWSTGAAYNARMRLGPSRCRSWAGLDVRARFRIIYEGFCDDILHGVSLPRKCFVRPYVVMPASVKPIEQAPVVRVANKAVGREALKGLKDLLS